MLDDAFDALKKYDWGTEQAPLAPIAALATAPQVSTEVRNDLERRLVAALQSEISGDARGFVCRMLALVGGAAAVPALAGLLADEKQAHMARYALERIPAPEAGQFLRNALPRLSGPLKIGVISSLGSRREASAVAALGSMLNERDASVARAAAIALGRIGTVEAARALQESQSATAEIGQAVIDAQLACAEALLADNKQALAHGIYKSLSGEKQARLVRLAATRGLLACAAKNA